MCLHFFVALFSAPDFCAHCDMEERYFSLVRKRSRLDSNPSDFGGFRLPLCAA